MSAIVNAWVPGEEGADAVAEALFGEVEPGGKLPVTIPRSDGQIPIYYGHKPSGGRSHWRGPYVDESNLPLWPFGYGLSYTRFEIANLQLSRATVPMDGVVTATVDVTNVGDRAGDEVVQLYIRDVEASVTRPIKELRGFKRVSLQPGETRHVSFELAVEQLAFTGVDGSLRVEPGAVTIMAGTSSEDLPCSAQIEIEVTLERSTGERAISPGSPSKNPAGYRVPAAGSRIGPVESRTIIVGLMIWSVVASGSSCAAMAAVTAAAAIAAVGMRTVVRDGVVYAAIGRSSYPRPDVLRDVQTHVADLVEHAYREHVGRSHDRRRSLRQRHESPAGHPRRRPGSFQRRARRRRAPRVPRPRRRPRECRATFARISDETAADERATDERDPDNGPDPASGPAGH